MPEDALDGRREPWDEFPNFQRGTRTTARPSASKARARELDRKARRASDAMRELLAPSSRSDRGTGSILSELLYRAQMSARPDGLPRESPGVSAPPLLRPSTYDRLRSGETDPLRRKREHGYQDESKVEQYATERMEDVCDQCKGTPQQPACRRCDGTGRRFHDPTAEAVVEIVASLEAVARLCDRIDKKRQQVIHARDAADGPATGENCASCHRPRRLDNSGRPKPNDPFRRGMCNTCATAFYVWRVDNGIPDDPSGDSGRFCLTEGPGRRHNEHMESTCDACAEERRKAGDDWKLDRGRPDHAFDRLDELQKRGELPTGRTP